MKEDRDAPSSSSPSKKIAYTSKENGKVWFSIERGVSSSWSKKSFLTLILLICTFLVVICWTDITTLAKSPETFTFSMFSDKNSKNYKRRDAYILNCTSSNMTITCPANYPPKLNPATTSNQACPEYFQWIHEDLKTWKEHGINREMVESLTKVAHFRLIIVNGTAYVKKYEKVFQTRDTYNLWGVLQLLKLYPGRLPDLDLMFQCGDESTIKRDEYKGDSAAFAPPQFHYCADESTLDIVFPDWSFWGWPEINIKPWVSLAKDLEKGNDLKNWTSRANFAFWKGNWNTGRKRSRLKECNNIEQWHAQIINQNWAKESREGFKNSDLSKQCVHRYKIYMEGNAWSVSEKYIFACDAVTLRVNPSYYDFFTRSLIPLKHYWPIDPENLCKSIKFAVEWGNNNTEKAQEIGKAGSEYIFNNLKMEYVYDYMFHVLNEYAKLLKYKPTVPEGAVELCSEFACSPPGQETTYKIETIVDKPADRDPCSLPPPYVSANREALRVQKEKIIELVAMLERASV